jgi:hypothetical protein
MPPSRKSATDRLLIESNELLAGIEEEDDEVTANHDVEHLNGDGRVRQESVPEMTIKGPWSISFGSKGIGGGRLVVIILAIAVLVVVIAGAYIAVRAAAEPMAVPVLAPTPPHS